MDKIKALKAKYDMQNEELNHSFRNVIPQAKTTMKKREQHLEELNTQLQELQSKNVESEESLNREKQILDDKMQKTLAASIRLNEREGDRNALMQALHEVENQRSTMSKQKPSVKDLQTMEHGKKKFEYYKKLTGIRWDFGAPKGTTKGYITNGIDHIHTFNYQDNEVGSKLDTLLWKDIERGTGRLDKNNSDSKENRMPNK